MLSSTISTVLAAAEAAAEEPEKSKTVFYVLGGILAVWAVFVSAVGISRPDFPEGSGAMRLVVAVTALLVAGAMASAVITA